MSAISDQRKIINFGNDSNKEYANNLNRFSDGANDAVMKEESDRLSAIIKEQKNPAALGLLASGQNKPGLDSHIPQSINDAKLAFITNSDCTKTWKTMTNIVVHDAVQLIPEDPSYGYTVSNSISKFSESDAGKTFNSVGKLISKLDKANKAFDNFKKSGDAVDSIKMLANQSVIFPRYDPAVSTGVPTIALKNDGFKFVFRMGMFGLYNAFEEVVKPAAALTLLCTPTISGDTASSPYATANQVLINYIEGVVEKFGGGERSAGSAQSDAPAEEATAVNRNAAASAVSGAVDTLVGIYKSVGGNTNFLDGKKYLNIYYGKVMFKYCAVTSLSVDFDNHQTDEYGCPTKATVEMKFVSSEGFNTDVVNRLINGATL